MNEAVVADADTIMQACLNLADPEEFFSLCRCRVRKNSLTRRGYPRTQKSRARTPDVRRAAHCSDYLYKRSLRGDSPKAGV